MAMIAWARSFRTSVEETFAHLAGEPVTESDASDLAQPQPARVTPMTSAERVRRHREKKRAEAAATALLFERPDWRLFTQIETLPQKAGCHPSDLRALAIKEVVDN